MKTILSGHISPETAYVVDDYPYGFNLRCRIRYWIDVNNKGARLASQTTNPKKPGWVWNKPKYSTYCKFGGCIFLNEKGHVEWVGLHEYTTGEQCREWRDTYGAGCPDAIVPLMNKWVNAKILYDTRKKTSN